MKDVIVDSEDSKMANDKHLVNQLDEKKKASMTSRIIVGAVLAVTCIPALVVGSWFWFAIISFFFLVAVYEICRAKQKKYPWYVWAITYVVCIIYMYWFLVKDNVSNYLAAQSAGTAWSFTLEQGYSEPNLSIYAIIVALGVYLFVSLINKDFDFLDVCYFVTMTILVSYGFQCLLFLRYHPFVSWNGLTDTTAPTFRFFQSAIVVIFIVIAAFGNDTMAYFVGMFFGKHKMTPRLSPNKTWEGFFGGWILGGGLALAFALICDANGFPMLPGVKTFGTAESRWWAIVLLSFTLPIIAVFGDLVFSSIKRHFGFKDYGTLLRAHGGVLDRVDSLIFCAMACSILIVIIEKGSGFFA